MYLAKDQLADWLEHYAGMHLEGSSVIRYRLHLSKQILPHFGSKCLIDLNAAEVEVSRSRLVHGIGAKLIHGQGPDAKRYPLPFPSLS